MDLQDPTFEQLVATMGVTMLAILAAVFVLMLLVMAGALKLSISLIARHRISFFGALGYLIAITFINALIGSVLGSLVGPMGGLIAFPLTIFATLACLSQAGNCGYLRAIGVYIVFCITGTIGMFGVFMVAVVPLAMIGDFEGLQAQFLEAQEEDFEFTPGEVQEVNWEAFDFEEDSASANPFDEPPVTATPIPNPPETNSVTSPQDSAATTKSSSGPPRPPARKAPTRKKPKPPVRAPDGTQLNPFFK